jgi:hypothetical protein
MTIEDHLHRATGEIANANSDARFHSDNGVKAQIHAINGVTYALMAMAEAIRSEGERNAR